MVVSPGLDPSRIRYEGPWTHHDIHANGIRLHIAAAGPDRMDAPLVVLVHGFADFWWTWHHQLPGLARLGYRAVAVDLRGYGDSDKPPRGYDGWTLAGDIAGLVRALGYTQASLVGHADGGLVCWATAVLHPRLVTSIALVNSPHPSAVRTAIVRDRQQRAAWLPDLLRWQLPRYPEYLLTRNQGAAIAERFRRYAGEHWAQSAECREAAARKGLAICLPGAAHCALEYQRWIFRSQWRPDGYRFSKAMRTKITVPVLALHAQHDRFVLARTVARAGEFTPRRQLRTIPGAGHFAHQENPAAVTEALAHFLD